MASRGFNIARMPTGSPNVTSYKYDSAATLYKGSLVVLASDGEVVIFGGGTDAEVLGVCAESSIGRPGGTGIANAPAVITGGNKDEVSVHVADRHTVFSCRGLSVGGGDNLTPAVTNIDEDYGVAVDADGQWYLDIDEVTTKLCKVVDIDIDRKIFFVKFLEAVLQIP